MLSFIRRCEITSIQTATRISRLSTENTPAESTNVVDEFRALELIPQKQEVVRKTRKLVNVQPPRAESMPTDQDWPSVWPGPRSFHPATVPLPLRQGYKFNNNPIPGKYANAELMKIPNFLHLTPPAIRKHCEALKQFCTKWPKGLETDEDCTKHFPLETVTYDYCYSSPTIRDPLARIVTIRVKLSSLKLDKHAKDKLLRLVGNRYDCNTDVLTITADRCPTRKQNLEYVRYLLTAVYNESWRVEPWEAEKSEADMEYYDWDRSKSRKNMVTIYKWPSPPTDFDYESIPQATEFKVAVSDLINNGEDQYSINKYKQAVKNLLNLKSDVDNDR